MRHRQKDETPSGQGLGFQSKAINRPSNCASLGTPDHEGLIKRLGQDLIVAYARSNKLAAQRYQRAMYQAIAQRPAAKQAQRFAEIDRAIAVSAGCYSTARVDADRAKLLGVN